MDHPGYGEFRARREDSIWQQLNRVLRALLAIAGLLVIVSLFLPRHKELTRSRSEIEALEARVNEQKTQFTRQTREVNLLKTDAEYLEMIARDRLDLMKEGETIYRLEAPKRK